MHARMGKAERFKKHSGKNAAAAAVVRVRGGIQFIKQGKGLTPKRALLLLLYTFMLTEFKKVGFFQKLRRTLPKVVSGIFHEILSGMMGSAESPRNMLDAAMLNARLAALFESKADAITSGEGEERDMDYAKVKHMYAETIKSHRNMLKKLGLLKLKFRTKSEFYSKEYQENTKYEKRLKRISPAWHKVWRQFVQDTNFLQNTDHISSEDLIRRFLALGKDDFGLWPFHVIEKTGLLRQPHRLFQTLVPPKFDAKRALVMFITTSMSLLIPLGILHLQAKKEQNLFTSTQIYSTLATKPRHNNNKPVDRGITSLRKLPFYFMLPKNFKLNEDQVTKLSGLKDTQVDEIINVLTDEQKETLVRCFISFKLNIKNSMVPLRDINDEKDKDYKLNKLNKNKFMQIIKKISLNTNYLYREQNNLDFYNLVYDCANKKQDFLDEFGKSYYIHYKNSLKTSLNEAKEDILSHFKTLFNKRKDDIYCVERERRETSLLVKKRPDNKNFYNYIFGERESDDRKIQ